MIIIILFYSHKVILPTTLLATVSVTVVFTDDGVSVLFATTSSTVVLGDSKATSLPATVSLVVVVADVETPL